MMSISVNELPKEIKAWFDGQFKRELKSTEKISIFAFTPDASNSYLKYFKKMSAIREGRLQAVATKMETLGMSKEDVMCVLRGGYKKGESYFLGSPKVR